MVNWTQGEQVVELMRRGEELEAERDAEAARARAAEVRLAEAEVRAALAAGTLIAVGHDYGQQSHLDQCVACRSLLERVHASRGRSTPPSKVRP